MVMTPLRQLRKHANINQHDAMARISRVTGGAVSPHRRQLTDAESCGTRNADLLKGMALVYGVPLACVWNANENTLPEGSLRMPMPEQSEIFCECGREETPVAVAAAPSSVPAH